MLIRVGIWAWKTFCMKNTLEVENWKAKNLESCVEAKIRPSIQVKGAKIEEIKLSKY